MSLQLLSLHFVLRNWRPGSTDRTWADEFADLGSPIRAGELIRTWETGPRDGLAIRAIRALLHDPDRPHRMMAPVVLGNDADEWNEQQWRGRVWAGHHRLWLAHTIPVDDVWCDVVQPGEKRTGEAAHCAPFNARDDSPPDHMTHEQLLDHIIRGGRAEIRSRT